MLEQSFPLSDEPTELSISLLIRSLELDSATRGVNPRSYAHRSRVIRQQTELLTKHKAGEAAAKSEQSATIMRTSDHREEGGQG
jgi:hypothetical protein